MPGCELSAVVRSLRAAMLRGPVDGPSLSALGAALAAVPLSELGECAGAAALRAGAIRCTDVAASPWATDAYPVSITGTARVLPGWGTQFGLPAEPPASPIDCASVAGGCGATIPVTLVPYGSTYLRLTEIPFVMPGGA